MPPPTSTHLKEEQISETKTAPKPIITRKKNHRISDRRQHFRNAFVLAFSGAWAAIILQYDPLGSRRSGSKLNEDQRQRNLWHDSYVYYQPALRRIARLGMQAQDFVVVQLSRFKIMEKITSQLYCHIQRLHLPQTFADPPPVLFLIACIPYAFSIAAFRHAHQKDRYQDFILWCGIAVALVGAWMSGNFMLESKSYLAWCIVSALALSSLVHRVLDLFAGREEQEQECGSV